MPLMRNPFRRVPGEHGLDDDGKHGEAGTGVKSHSPSTPINIQTGDEKSNKEYKLSEINDSGVYLPPSPTEKPKFRTTRSYNSTTSTMSHRSVFNEHEPFNISRESFESYRRSFDISARSPVIPQESERPRHSLDARQTRLRKSSVSDKQMNPPEAQPEERFEDVGLEDAYAKPKKPGFLSRFGGQSSESTGKEHKEASAIKPASNHFGSQLFGRKRGQSGQGSELAAMQNEQSNGQAPEVTEIR